MAKKFEPIQYACCYSLDLYCDRENGADNCAHDLYNNKMETFTGETFAECAKQAREEGWKVHRKTRTATCPQCNELTKKAQRILRKT